MKSVNKHLAAIRPPLPQNLTLTLKPWPTRPRARRAFRSFLSAVSSFTLLVGNGKTLYKSASRVLAPPKARKRKRVFHFHFLSPLAPGGAVAASAFCPFFKTERKNSFLFSSPSKGRPAPISAAVVLARRRRHQHDLQRASAQPPRRAVVRSLRELAARERRRRRSEGGSS